MLKTKQGNALFKAKRAFPCNEESLSLIQRNALFEWKKYKPVGTDALVCPYFEALSLIGNIYTNQLSLGVPPLRGGWVGFPTRASVPTSRHYLWLEIPILTNYH